MCSSLLEGPALICGGLSPKPAENREASGGAGCVVVLSCAGCPGFWDENAQVFES